MPRAAFDEDRVKSFFDLGDPSNGADGILLSNLTFNSCWPCEEPLAGLTEHLDNGTVLKLADEIGVYLTLIEPSL